MFEFEALSLLYNLRVLYHVQSSIIFDQHPPVRKIKDMCPQILREKCLGCQQIFPGKAGPSCKPIPFLQNSICCMLLIFPTGNVGLRHIETIESQIGSLICYYPAGFLNVCISWRTGHDQILRGTHSLVSRTCHNLQLSIPTNRAVPVCIVLCRLCTSLYFARLALRVVFETFQDNFLWYWVSFRFKSCQKPATYLTVLHKNR